MFLLLSVIIILIIVFFGHTLVNLLSSINTVGQSSKLNSGYLWFISLLILNVTILAFIIGFYYYKINTPGKSGISGEFGIPGESGDDGFATVSCVHNG